MFYKIFLAALLISLTPSAQADKKKVVNIYTYRQPDLIQPVLSAFTKETGIETRILFLDKGLEERVLAEGQNSPADIIMTVDISQLTRAKEKGITQSLKDKIINSNIPSEYRDPDGHWFGLTRRARVVYASLDRVSKSRITYAELAEPQWKGRICIRSGQHDYNIALFSAAIAHWGVEKTEEWMKGLKKNMARKPQGGDRAQASSVAVGECDIALGNTYYIALMRNAPKNPEEKRLVDKIKIIFPTFENGMTHVNISGISLARNAPNPNNAIRLMRFLSGIKSQKIYSEKNFEYPVAPGLEPSPEVSVLGELHADPLPLIQIAANRKLSSEMVDRVGFDSGPND